MAKALFIGGTGTISSAIVEELSKREDWEVWVLNRGNHALPSGVHQIVCDISDEESAREKLAGLSFDVVSEFIGFEKAQIERDYRLFKGKCKQYIYISSASAYAKPAPSHIITEGTTLSNPYWQYSRNKIECEEFLLKKYREEGFPVTIVRPSHTYNESHIPLGVHGKKGFYQVIKRMLDGKPVIIHGDGTSLWHVTFNKDFATGFIALMQNPHALGEAFQITGDEVLSWNQIYQTIADALGVKLNAYYVSSDYLSAVGKKYGYDFEGSLLGDKAVSVVFDNTKLKRVAPQMKTTIPFSKGVRIALDYVMSHKECQVLDEEFDEWCDKVIRALEESKNNI